MCPPALQMIAEAFSINRALRARCGASLDMRAQIAQTPKEVNRNSAHENANGDQAILGITEDRIGDDDPARSNECRGCPRMTGNAITTAASTRALFAARLATPKHKQRGRAQTKKDEN